MLQQIFIFLFIQPPSTANASKMVLPRSRQSPLSIELEAFCGRGISRRSRVTFQGKKWRLEMSHFACTTGPVPTLTGRELSRDFFFADGGCCAHFPHRFPMNRQDVRGPEISFWEMNLQAFNRKQMGNAWVDSAMNIHDRSRGGNI